MNWLKTEPWEKLDDGYQKNIARIGYWHLISALQKLDRSPSLLLKFILATIIIFLILSIFTPLVFWKALLIPACISICCYYIFPVLQAIFLFKEANIPIYGSINTLIEKIILPGMGAHENDIREYFQEKLSKNEKLLKYNVLFMSNKKAAEYLMFFISFDDLLIYLKK